MFMGGQGRNRALRVPGNAACGLFRRTNLVERFIEARRATSPKIVFPTLLIPPTALQRRWWSSCSGGEFGFRFGKSG
jgi:hypothetical protein